MRTSDLQIAPFYQGVQVLSSVHAVICLLALFLHRIMRSRVRKNINVQSPNGTVRILNSVKQNTVNISGESHARLCQITEQQINLIGRLVVEKPNALEVQVKYLCGDKLL